MKKTKYELYLISCSKDWFRANCMAKDIIRQNKDILTEPLSP